VFFDVGANIGLFTVVASDAVGKAGEVHAFEPCGKTFSRLGENVDLNGVVNVRLNQLALSAEPGRLELNVSVDGHDAWNSCAGTLAGGEGTREVVEVCTLDGYCMSRKLWPNLVKVDVEGWEASVLRGGQSVLQSHRSPDLLVEFTRSNCIAAGTSTNELFKQITSFGYELFHVDSVAEPRPAAADEDFPYCYLLATKDLPAVRRRLVR
jgi:FkbM family methyltransferase